MNGGLTLPLPLSKKYMVSESKEREIMYYNRKSNSRNKNGSVCKFNNW
nr:MAG TPA: hypothetical protein [Bacteriophage sp.]DAZ78793.1 MAG TPA: hypothetical protein [Caudoviricetes sp.]